MSALRLRDALRRPGHPVGAWAFVVLSLALGWACLAGTLPAAPHEVAEAAVTEPGEAGEGAVCTSGPPTTTTEVDVPGPAAVLALLDTRLDIAVSRTPAPSPLCAAVDVGERRRWRARALGSRGPPTHRV